MKSFLSTTVQYSPFPIHTSHLSAQCSTAVVADSYMTGSGRQQLTVQYSTAPSPYIHNITSQCTVQHSSSSRQFHDRQRQAATGMTV